jgi:hypothetical protein
MAKLKTKSVPPQKGTASSGGTQIVSAEDPGLGLQFSIGFDFRNRLQELGASIDSIIEKTESEIFCGVMRPILEESGCVDTALLMTYSRTKNQIIIARNKDSDVTDHAQIRRLVDYVAEKNDAQLAASMRGTYWSCLLPHPDGTGSRLLVSGIPGVQTGTLIVVEASDSHEWLRNILESAAQFMGICFFHKSRSQSTRRAITRMSHLSSGYVETATLRLGLLEELLGGEIFETEKEKLYPLLRKLREDLTSSKNALNRATIWYADPSPVADQVSLAEILQDVADDLSQVNPLDSPSFIRCLDKLSGVALIAPRSRLTQAIRDCMLGAWILSSRTKIHWDAQVSEHDATGSSGIKKVSLLLTLTGEGLAFDSERYDGERLSAVFFDPEVFCLTATRGISERFLTFDCTRELLRQMSTEIEPRIIEGKFSLQLRFRNCQLLDQLGNTTDASHEKT